MAAEPVPRAGLRRATGVMVAVGVAVAGAACSLGSGPSVPSTSPNPGGWKTSTDGSSLSTPISPVPTGAASHDGDTPQSGIQLTARADPDGSFEVTEAVRLDDSITTLTLRPPDFTVLGGDLGRAKPVASEVEVVADRRAVKVPSRHVRSSISVALPAPARLITLRYRLTGVSKRSQPSAPGRALAAVAPLMAGVPDDLPVAVAVPGRTVRNLQCPTLVEQACATGAVGQLRIVQPLPWHSAIVVVQLDMT